VVTRDFEREEFRRFTRFFAWLSGALAVVAGAVALLMHATGRADEALAVPLLVGGGVLLVVAALFAWPSMSQQPAAGPDEWPAEAAPDADAEPE
jgi:hypothetical protein